MDSSGKLLKRTQHPVDVEIFRDQSCGVDSVTIKPSYNVGIQLLIPRRVIEQPLPDNAKSPHQQECDDGNDNRGDRNCDREGEQRRNLALQGALERPHQRNDKYRKRNRHEYRPSEIQRGEYCNDSAKAEHNLN